MEKNSHNLDSGKIQGEGNKINSFNDGNKFDIPVENENTVIVNKEHQSKTPIQDDEKVVYNVIELMALGNIQPKYLMKPILPQKGTAVLAGKPDTGKSQFARQLCISVASNDKKFLDFNLNPSHNKALYIATEDDRDSVKFLADKQFKGLGKSFNDNLRFIFADTLSQKEIFKILKTELTKEAVDLVVIDSFGDVFRSNDSNNNMAMRNTVKGFDRIAKKNNCLILFVHHINKGGYRQSPSQEHIQGGSGLVQKVRLAMQLSDGDGDTRYLSVVKGNYCPKIYKSNSLVLNFSEETFLFTDTGETIITTQIGNKNDNSVQIDKHKNEKKEMQSAMGDKEYQHSDLVDLFCKMTGKKDSTAKRAIKYLTETTFLSKLENGKYQITNA
jgi:RecA-family ATPase